LKIAEVEIPPAGQAGKKAEPGKAPGFSEIPGTEKIIPCELALLAMGFMYPQHNGLLDRLGVDYDERGNVKATRYQTSIESIFTAGDMRRGQSLVVWAISEGREAARAVDEYLMGQSILESKEKGILSLS
jgi:glutamate synthase (NADPH/NADH) small chain